MAALNITLDQFSTAIAYLESQGLDIKGLDLRALYAQEASTAELAVRLMLVDIAAKALESAQEGATAEALAQALAGALEAFDPRLSMDASIRTAYAAGRWDRSQNGPMDYLVYRTMRDGRVRPTHAALNNVALPKTHPFWQSHFPPLAYRCRCKAFATDAEGLARLGLEPQDTPPDEPTYTDSSGQVVPASVSPGFLTAGKTPALAARETLANLLAERIASL